MGVARRTVLNQWHRTAGATMSVFAGWEMPMEYPTGIVAEHEAVRSSVGMFDVSHMGKVVVRGPGALDALNRVLANDLARIGDGRAQYTLLCNDAGGIVDDLIAYRVGEAEVRLVPNAANAARVVASIAELVGPDAEVIDRHDELAMIAVQGPASSRLLVGLGLMGSADELAYMQFADRRWRGEQVMLCRTGYTGERGYEVILPNGLALALWSALGESATACGLTARDTLRTEMGYPLHGQDISEQVTPIEAGLSWAVGWDKAQFVGRKALLAQRSAGRTRALRGIRVTGRGIARPGMRLQVPGGTDCGVVTSGTFSPTLRAAIAIALVDAVLQAGDEVVIDIRGRRVPAAVTAMPFVAASPK